MKQKTDAELQLASERFWSARERGDASLVAEQFTETGILMIPGLPDAEGRRAIADLLKLRFASARIADFNMHRREVEVAGESAYELAWFSETSHHKDGGPTRFEGRYLVVWKRGDDGAWRVHRHFYNFSAATPLEAASH